MSFRDGLGAYPDLYDIPCEGNSRCLPKYEQLLGGGGKF